MQKRTSCHWEVKKRNNKKKDWIAEKEEEEKSTSAMGKGTSARLHLVIRGGESIRGRKKLLVSCTPQEEGKKAPQRRGCKPSPWCEIKEEICQPKLLEKRKKKGRGNSSDVLARNDLLFSSRIGGVK